MIQSNISLRDKNWFNTGGTALHYAEPKTHTEFVFAYSYARQNNLRVFVLGQGANCLISDDGFNGLVIKPMLIEIVHTINDNKEVFVTAGAGVTITDLINY